jgi:phosphopantothenoylcysteine decarboxylase/phosphopantothenate--cysteine ligase
LSRQRPDGQVAIGFALETDDGVARARQKRERKRLDAIVLNGPDAIGAETADYAFITDRTEEDWTGLTKDECARRIMERAAALGEERRKAAKEQV